MKPLIASKDSEISKNQPKLYSDFCVSIRNRCAYILNSRVCLRNHPVDIPNRRAYILNSRVCLRNSPANILNRCAKVRSRCLTPF